MRISFRDKTSLSKTHFDIFTIYRRYTFSHEGYHDDNTNEYVEEIGYYVDYTSYILFINGEVIINPKNKDLIQFEESIGDLCDGSFDEDLLAYIIPGKKTVTKRFSEPINFKLYDRNKEGYFRLLELKKKEKRKTISTRKRLKSIKFILNEFIQWFENEGLISQLESDLAIPDNPSNSKLSKQSLVPAKPFLNMPSNSVLSNSSVRQPLVWSGDKDQLIKLISNLMTQQFISSVVKIDETVKPSKMKIDDIIDVHFAYPCKSKKFKNDNKHFIKWERPQDELAYLFNELLPENGLISSDKIYKLIESHCINQKNKPFKNKQLSTAYHSESLLKITKSSEFSRKLESKKRFIDKLRKIVEEL